METKKVRVKRKKPPQHAVVMRAFRFPIEPTPLQYSRLFLTCDLLCEVRNILVAERETNRWAIREQKQTGCLPMLI